MFLGKIVMTDYNKRTYRVDDVDWSASPNSTFQMRGDNVSYMEYYQKVWFLFLFPLNWTLH